MGVIDDSDVEKIVEAYKKTRTWKGFYDPKKARNAFNAAFFVGYAGILILGAAFITTWLGAYDDQATIKDYGTFADIVTENTDCKSLETILKELRHGDYTGTVIDDIKDEIEFRC